METNNIPDAERAAAVEDQLAAKEAAAANHLKVVAELKAEIKRLTDGLAPLTVTGAALGPHSDALPDDFAELGRLAALATPGPWLHRHDPGNPVGMRHGVKLAGELGTWVCDCMDNADKRKGAIPAGDRNAAFIAAANPSVILRLLDALSRTAPADRPSDTGGAIPADFSVSRYSDTRNRGVLVIFERRLTDAELEAVRAALASKGDTGGDLSAALNELHTGLKRVNRSHDVEHLIHQIIAIKALATAPRAAIPTRDAVLEEAAQAVVGMGSTDPIMSYGQLCAAAIRKLKGVAAIPAAGSSAEDERRKRLNFILGQCIHNQVVAQQAAWIEWQHGKGADAAMQWIENGLVGPGHIPNHEGKTAQEYFDANVDERMEPAAPTATKDHA